MKKIKYIITLALIMVLTGCSAEYNIEINHNYINEELKILNDTENKSNAYSYMFAIEDESKLYDFTKKGNDATYKYRYLFSNFEKSNFANKCFSAFKAYSKDGIYTIQTGSHFLCDSLDAGDYGGINYDSLVVKIKVNDYEVIDNNADEIKDNVYIWNIDKNNLDDNKITLQFKLQKENGSQKEEEQEEKTNNNDKKSSFNFMYVLIGAGIFGIILVVVLLYGVTLNKKRNKL